MVASNHLWLPFLKIQDAVSVHLAQLPAVGVDKQGVQILLREQGLEDDVAYGKTKLFIRTPRTVYALEEARSHLIPPIAMFLPEG